MAHEFSFGVGQPRALNDSHAQRRLNPLADEEHATMCHRISMALLTSLLSATVALTGCRPQQVLVVSNERPQPVTVLRRFNGNDPGLKEPMVRLISSAGELESLGSYDLAVQSIDYDKESLLLLALGEKPTGGYWARITGVQRKGGLLYVQGLANRPSADAAVSQRLTYPYDAVVIRKIRNARIRSEIESVLGKHPQQYRDIK